MKNKFYSIIIPILLITTQCSLEIFAVDLTSETTLQLAVELSEDQFPSESAIEFRRLALSTEIESEQAAYHWMAAHQYFQAENNPSAEAELDRMEKNRSSYSTEATLLRAKLAERQYDYDTASFFFESIADSNTESPLQEYVERSRASLLLKSGQFETIQTVTKREDILKTLEDYRTSPTKKPWLGGLLGVIPGLGYAYSGEYGNAVRSLILNSIFIYGMVDTAGDDEWGAFAVITFFEITWYTGSIYGGIDSAERYNQAQLNDAIHSIMGDASFAPDYPSLPILKLNFTF